MLANPQRIGRWDRRAANAQSSTSSPSDTAANVSSAIDKLNNDPHAKSITLTDSGTPVPNLTPAQAALDAALLAQITNTVFEEIIGVSGQPALSTSAFGGGFTVAFGSVQGMTADVHKTNSGWDAVNGSNGNVKLTNAQASIIGGVDTIILYGSSNVAAL
jgi:hypothetical protein